MSLTQQMWDIVIVILYYLRLFSMYLTGYNKHNIHKVTLVYTRDGEVDESDMTVEYKMYGPKAVLKDTSPDVTDTLFEIEYTYNFKKYVMLTRRPDHVFPPIQGETSFRVPIQEAYLLDTGGAPIENVTKDLKMYEGPNLDFHGETILAKDLKLGEMGGEPEKIRLVNVLGISVEYDIEEDSFTHRTIWLPNKT